MSIFGKFSWNVIEWRLCEESYSSMADESLTAGRMNESFVSDFRDSEEAFELLYGAVKDCLNCNHYEELQGDACKEFVEDIQSCMDADKIIMSVFLYSLLIERYKGIHFQTAEKIVVAACVIMNHFIYKNRADKGRCDEFDRIVKTGMGYAMKTAVKDNPDFYGMDEGLADADAEEGLMDFIEDVYGRFKKMFQYFYPGITW